MSGYLAGKVWQSALAPHLKPLAAALADIANDDGTRIYPSVAYVAWLLGRSPRAVQDGLAELREAGVLAVVAFPDGGRGRATHYQMIESALPEREPWPKGADRSYPQQRVQPASPFSIGKGATPAPFVENAADHGEKGAVYDTKGADRDIKGAVSSKRVQFTTVKGEAGCTLPVIEPLLRTVIEPPNDTEDFSFFDEWLNATGRRHSEDPRGPGDSPAPRVTGGYRHED
jgi:hypothetical protein